MITDSELREAFRAFIEQASEGIVLVDEEGFIIEWNKGEEAITGIKSTEAIGRYLWDVQFDVLTDEQKKHINLGFIKSMIIDTLKTGIIPINIIEQTIMRPNRSFCTMDARIFTIKTTKGFMIGSINSDITDRSKSREALKASEERYRIVAETADDFIYIVDKDLKVIYLNKSGMRSINMKQYEYKGMPLEKIFPPHTYEHMKNNLLKIFDSGKSMSDKHIFKFYGKEYWLHVKLTPIKDKDGSVKAVMGISRDITDIKMAEEALEESEGIFRALAETSMSIIVLIQDDKIVYINPRCKDIIGFTKEEILHTDFLDLVHPDCRDIVKERYAERVIGKDNPVRYDIRIVGKNGETVWVDASMTIINYRGMPSKLITAVDITEKKQKEKELKDAKALAELYLDVMGHDINNMNQVAMGFQELALDTLTLNEHGRYLLSKPLAALENSSRLIDNVRKLQRIKAGKISRKEIDVGKVLGDIQHDYLGMHGSSITIYYTPVSGCMVNANELLYEIFSNLVGNAIKYANGHPVISIELEKVCKYDSQYYQVTVDDNGRGIPDELKPTIFMRQLQDGSKPRGSGIGLYLAKTLVDDYGGLIWVENRVKGDASQGSRFIVMLPAIS